MVQNHGHVGAIEITPAMIEAGVSALFPVEVPAYEDSGDVVIRVFSSMEKARNLAGGLSTQRARTRKTRKPRDLELT